MSVVKNELTLESHEKEQEFVRAETVSYGQYVISPGGRVGYCLGMQMTGKTVQIIVWLGAWNAWDYARDIKVKRLVGHHTIKLEVVSE